MPTLLIWIERRLRPARDEDGDVPGWVMITVMSAGIVAALTAIAGPELSRILSQALASVGG
ncbi:MAG: hypothetical protein QM621_12190 [Aeromicrobium sp.]|uniref:hypothetical protein n=1 Tax=Aeromicrobium sp. TaxID=1871063 RepID=UPI0039E4E217